MKAMIFAAGLGTRLRPLTNNKPKALVEIDGIPLLEICIQRLKYFGFNDLIINVHHFGDQIIQFLKEKDNFGISITISDEREKLLNTGGGLKFAEHFFDQNESFLLCNADILTDLNLKELFETHCKSGALATLATRFRETSRYLMFNKNNELVGWQNIQTDEIKWSKKTDKNLIQNRAFSGVHILNSKIFSMMPDEDVFSIIPLYLNVAKTERILEYPHDEGIWLDVGKLPALEKAPDILKLIKRVGQISLR